MTQNKFLEGVGRPEVVDDWDQRLLMTTLLLEREARKITLIQVAEKDQVRNIVRCFVLMWRESRHSVWTARLPLL